MHIVRPFAISIAMLFVLCGCTQQAASTGTPPFKPVANVKEIMESLVAHMAEDVWGAVGTIVSEKGIEEIKPKDAIEWEEVRMAAMGLAETGNLLMFDARAKDKGDWIKFSSDLVDKAVAAAKTAEAKDPDRLLEAGGNLYEACVACHQKYVPQEPGGAPTP